MSSKVLWKWDGKSKWDVFQSQSHECHLNNELTPWMIKTLQILRFVMFLVSHLLLIFGAATSKLIVILLATNIDLKASGSYFEKKCNVREEEARSSEVTISVIFALWLIQNIPDVMAIIQSLYRIYKYPKERKCATLLLFVMECCRSIGIATLFFHVFPSLDPLHCLILSVSTVFMPLYFKIKGLIRCSFDPIWTLKNRLKLLVDSCSYSILFLIIFSSCYMWSIIDVPFFKYIALPLSLILSSFGFWDIWIDESHSMSSYRYLYQLKYGMRKMSSMTRFMVSMLRILTSTAVVWIVKFRYLPFKIVKRSLIENESVSQSTIALYTLAMWIIFLNFFLRFISRLLSTMSMRVLAALHPLLIIVPLPMIIFIGTCFIKPLCAIHRYLFTYDLRWHCLAWKVSQKSLQEICFGVIWLIAYLFWAYQHAKAPKFDPDDDVFDTITSILNGLMVEQSLIVYRVSLNKKKINDDRWSSEGTEVNAGDIRITNDEIDKTVTLYICATMWHETRIEMMQMLKSIMKLDKEHSLIMAKRRRSDDIRYRLEAHIFFDDAWEDQAECGRTPNAFFQTFFHLLLELTQNENTDEKSDAKDRVLVNTAYGGRLVVRLPAGTLLFVHLKDKQLVRHKKRWSQVMYLYYLLGHRIMDSHMSVDDRQLEADNTYILAIDGDSKFEPSSVMKLLRLMNMKNEIGCACGRIHPIGEGIMIWYQKFEYAISHWFQKATEHIFGCVLCAPGCFSLFRASALMDDNIMHKYTKIACEARHFVQYDQGEDRWLSTLLLKQGYRIEYAAFADAETYAPESFHEFFNQRRRWTPSSIANTIDLLTDYKRVCQNNNSISKMYILYQSMVISFSLLSPSIVFTMLVYAQASTFEVESAKMLLYNSLPIFTFIMLCFFANSNYQIIFAKFISVLYGFIMLAVAMATINQIILETAISPTPIFVLCMIGIFILAAILHPQEFHNIIYGPIFFLMIPCTYIFMALYALINLNIINWGTREAASIAAGKHASDTELHNLLQRLGFFKIIDFARLTSSLRSNTNAIDIAATAAAAAAAEMEKMKKKVANMETELQKLKERDLDSNLSSVHSNSNTTTTIPHILFVPQALLNNQKEQDKTNDKSLFSSSSTPLKTLISKENMHRFLWMDTEYLQVCSRGRLNAAEDEFWNGMIEQYLKPLEITEEETRQDVANLASLRNRIASLVLIVNGLLVLAVFLIQKHKEILSFEYKPYEGFEWSKLSKKTGKFELTDEPLKVEPIGLFVIAFLLIILVVQTCGMFAHRINTLLGAFHEVSNIEDFNFSNKNIEDEDEIMKNAQQMFDTTLYENAHGTDGYVRVHYNTHAACNLYKLQRAKLIHQSSATQVSRF
uniref:chitin synthase n=2 Tax=Dirofilaria immitis TaxID=6287 RepID=Q9GQ90_DIRIM|nr:chitin synthase [Dirofilaria immitis]